MKKINLILFAILSLCMPASAATVSLAEPNDGLQDPAEMQYVEVVQIEKKYFYLKSEDPEKWIFEVREDAPE